MLAVAGVALGHMGGYAAAHPDAAAREAALGGHAYLPTVAAAVIPVGVVAALGWAIATARTMGMAGRLSFGRLAGAQLAVFAVQEVAERVVAGDPALSVLGERGVWFGFVAQIVVAWCTTRLIHAVRRVVRRVAAGRAPRRTAAGRIVVAFRRVTASVPASPAPIAVGLRAPPVG